MAKAYSGNCCKNIAKSFAIYYFLCSLFSIFSESAILYSQVLLFLLQ